MHIDSLVRTASGTTTCNTARAAAADGSSAAKSATNHSAEASVFIVFARESADAAPTGPMRAAIIAADAGIHDALFSAAGRALLNDPIR